MTYSGQQIGLSQQTVKTVSVVVTSYSGEFLAGLSKKDLGRLKPQPTKDEWKARGKWVRRPALPENRCLIVLDETGEVEVYGDDKLDVCILERPWCPGHDRKIDEYLWLTMPKRFRAYFFPGYLQRRAQCSHRLPTDLIAEDECRELLKKIDEATPKDDQEDEPCNEIL